MKKENSCLPARVRKIRQALGMTQTEFAQELGIGQAEVSAIERGYRRLSNRNRRLLEERLGVNQNFLEDGHEPIFYKNIQDEIELTEMLEYIVMKQVASVIEKIKTK